MTRIDIIAVLVARGLTHAEVAARVGLQPSTVATMCHRAGIPCSNAPAAIAKRGAIKATAVRRAWADPELRKQRIESMRQAHVRRNGLVPPPG